MPVWERQNTWLPLTLTSVYWAHNAMTHTVEYYACGWTLIAVYDLPIVTEPSPALRQDTRYEVDNRILPGRLVVRGHGSVGRDLEAG